MLAAVTGTILIVAGNAGSVQADSTLETVYHVYVDGNHIGSLEEKKAFTNLTEALVDTYKEEYPDLSLQIEERIQIIPEMVFDTRVSSNQAQTLEKLEALLSVKAKATALEVNGDAILYVNGEEAAKDVLKDFIVQYTSDEQFEAFLNRQVEEATPQLEVGERFTENIELTEEIELKEVLIEPQAVLSPKKAVEALNKGVRKEQIYQVKEGDVLGSIAHAHDLTMNDLLSLNPELKEDSILQIGQEITVMAYEPVTEVKITELRKVEEAILYETEVKEDDSLWKGEQRVTQQGAKGTRIVDYTIVKKSGETIHREKTNVEIVKEPVKKIIVKGTKEMPSRGTGSLSWPAVGGYISSYQGERWGRFHKGIDIARPSNYNILAADNGKVTFAGTSGGYGNMVRINHNNGMETLYAHLRSIDVRVGQTVTQGQKIGVMGSTGNSTGIHLHFEVYQNGQLKNPMDYLN